MSLWEWLRGQGGRSGESVRARTGPVPLPTDPYVLECRECGKVFEATSRRGACPECDSENVEVVSE